MITLLYAFLFLAVVTGCSPETKRATSQHDTNEISILDEIMSREDVKARAKAVERDLPTDEWREGGETRPGRYNVSRSSREGELAVELLDEIKPKLSQMSAAQLVNSIKTYSMTLGSFYGTDYYFFLIGNSMIMKELQSRPKSELESLRDFRTDNREVWTGDNGPPCNIGDFIRIDLLDELGKNTNGFQ